MSENNFEKQLQEKMGDLKMIPSSEVWKGVSSRINKKDRKDKFIFLLYFILGGIVFTGAWYGYNQHFQNSKPSKISTNIVDVRKVNTIRNTNTTKYNKEQDVKRPLSGRRIIADNKIANTQFISHFNRDAITKINTRRDKRTLLRNFPKTSSKWQLGNSSQDQIVLNRTPDKKLNQMSAEQDSILDRHITSINAKNDSIRVKVTDKDSNKLVIKQLNVPTTKKHKWEYGLTLMGGLTQIGNNLLSLDKNLSSPASYTTAVQGQNSGTLYKPLTNSASFNVGIISKKQISKQVNFYIGAAITYYSTIRKPRQDSFQNRTNRFIFVDLPLSIEWRLNKQNHFPIFLESGLDFSQLLFTNAVQFDQDQYIRNNSLFNKMQIGINLSISTQLANNRYFKLFAGPKLQYDLTKIAGSGEYAAKHFAFAGIQTRIVFYSKK